MSDSVRNKPLSHAELRSVRGDTQGKAVVFSEQVGVQGAGYHKHDSNRQVFLIRYD